MYLTSGQKADADALADAPTDMDCVADGTSDDVFDAVAVTLTVTETEADRDTVMLRLIDMDVDAVAPSVSEPVDVALDVGVAEGESEMLYEGDCAQKAGIAG